MFPPVYGAFAGRTGTSNAQPRLRVLQAGAGRLLLSMLCQQDENLASQFVRSLDGRIVLVTAAKNISVL